MLGTPLHLCPLDKNYVLADKQIGLLNIKVFKIDYIFHISADCSVASLPGENGIKLLQM
jgi:hypothetical protein